MKQGTTLFLLIFFVPWMLHAQEAPQTISLQQAVEFAIKHNKELQSSQMNIHFYRLTAEIHLVVEIRGIRYGTIDLWQSL